MIINMTGDLLKSNCDILCHQTNCQGVMGAGIALQIKKQFPKCYEEYVQYCTNNEKLLGTVLYVSDKEKIIANLFGQDNCCSSRLMTDYRSLEKCVENVFNYAIENNLSVGFPFGIGCGLAGGNWDIVFGIIKKYFEYSEIDCYIYKFQ